MLRKILLMFVLLLSAVTMVTAQDSLDVSAPDSVGVDSTDVSAKDSLALYIWHNGVAESRNISDVDSLTFAIAPSPEPTPEPEPEPEPEPDPDADKYVDLGLSVKWAKCNLGSEAPEGYGDYYAWGETETKSSFTTDNYKFLADSVGIPSKYNTTDNKVTLDSCDDAASIVLGAGWRIPTQTEWQELSENCTWTWTAVNGNSGFEVKASNGNSIFLPAAGYRYGSETTDEGIHGNYWSSSLISSGSDVESIDIINGYRLWVDNYYRYGGESVRPVHD